MPKPESVFAWYDDYWLSTSKPHPFALVARALLVAEYHQATVRERGEDEEEWVVYGIADAAGALARAGEYHALGMMLTARSA